MKKTMTVLVAGIMFVALTLAGCSTQENGSPDVTTTPTPSPSATVTQENLQKVTYIISASMGHTPEMYVFVPDYSVKRYEMHSYNVTIDDLLAGDLPPDSEYTLTEYQISEEDWNALVNALNDNNFAELPERLQRDAIAEDVPNYYVQVETSDWDHETGCCTFRAPGDDEENKRFRAVDKKIDEIMKTAQELPYHQYQ